MGWSGRCPWIWKRITNGGVRMTFSRDDPRTHINVRVKEETKEELKEYAENNGINMSDMIRSLISDEIENAGEIINADVSPPVEKELRDSWILLNEISNDKDNVNADLALSALAQQQQISKELVKETIIKKLDKRGYLMVEPRMTNVVYNLRVTY